MRAKREPASVTQKWCSGVAVGVARQLVAQQVGGDHLGDRGRRIDQRHLGAHDLGDDALRSSG